MRLDAINNRKKEKEEGEGIGESNTVIQITV